MGKAKPPRRGKRGESAKGQPDTDCSTTQANTEWESVDDDELYGDSDTMEPMSLYCLQERINSRLVGSIKNSRAYDKKPTQNEMSFF
eukprot:NODE_2683_length_409_cov_55.650000_g2602_i0.p2 GENE.NODE_2683_length_409_cov_55.650000_g2602_i0~~NODE_2683_length_409_cov_55.650000_g2602_i0.p2  ORF type:complete len:94 (+),score=25.94 NODE_2683_length_409_cov_55.650000_g2602_i0:24-284(+)